MIIASIDIGTNTVLLLIAESSPSSGKFKVLFNEYRIPRIGKDLFPGGNISDEKQKALYEVLKEYSIIIKSFDCRIVLAAATNAFRIAKNSSEITSYVKDNFNIEIQTITGDREAELSFYGAAGSYSEGKRKLVIDIGGGSTEIIYGTGMDILFKKSYPIGVVNSSERFHNVFEPGTYTEYLREAFDGITDHKLAPVEAIAVAGTPTTLACIHKGLNFFDEDKVEGTALTKSDVRVIAGGLEKLTPGQIKEKYKTVVSGREDLILSGSHILLYLMDILNLPEIIVSTKGIRYGLIIDYLNTNNLDSEE